MTVEIEENEPPEWMIALENKQKRQHKLAHEIGAGAPCLSCKDACIGLDLHFWRKICRNCKCKKEDHNVTEENSFEHFEVLFGDNLKTSDRVKKLSLDLKFKLKNIPPGKDFQGRDSHSTATKTEDDLLFDWIPADIPVNLASEYLQSLPLEKLPITGSAGAIFRRQQLQKQIPLYDFKINNCDDLTEEETVAFTEYVDNLKTHAVGKGQITKIQSNESDSFDNRLKPPIVSANLNSSPKPFRGSIDTRLSSTETDPLMPLPSEFLPSGSVDLKTPSAFVSCKKPIVSNSKPEITNNNVPYTIESITCDKYNESSKPITELATQYSQKLDLIEKHVEQPTLNQNTFGKLNINEKDAQNNNWFINDMKSENVEPSNLKPSEIIRKLNAQRPPVNSMNNSTNTLDVASSSRSVDGKFMRITNPVEGFLATSSYVPNVPQLSNTFATSPRTINRNPKTRFESPANVESQKCLRSMSPNFIVPEVDCNMQCHQCKLNVLPGQIVVVAERAGVEEIWHPQCFVCVICQELLVDLVYFFHRGDVYCGRHYAEVLKIPRCFACDELIFLKEYTVAENQTFHVKHFCCFECDEPLAGKQYVPKDDNPVCLPCYEKKYGKECHFCEQIIKAGDSRVAWNDLSWHATESCFKCTQCYKSLLGGRFVVRNENPLCSKECAARLNESFER